MIDWGEASVQHCPSTEIWLDILTKPKHGHEFFLMSSKLLGSGVNGDRHLLEADDYPEQEPTRVHEARKGKTADATRMTKEITSWDFFGDITLNINTETDGSMSYKTNMWSLQACVYVGSHANN